ncbi:MAG: isochorismatase family cysteine hydrolase [Succinivibrio sp.]|jgi:nicotinamidase-related amidase|nr:isochorismatase family cysteine hydrolase [Succinivibrio sp.]
MKKDILLVVDVQNDFVDGALGTKEAQAMLPELLKTVKGFKGEVIFTLDTHPEDYLKTQEGRNLPVPHCIRGTKGWELVPELEKFRETHGCKIYEKPTFGSTALAEDLRLRFETGAIGSVTVCGLCTDICVISNALLLKASMPELEIRVLPECCAGVTPEKHAHALDVLASCQILPPPKA